ncbi:MAG: DUF1018 domain-containing protein [Chitinivibrionales bacterium]|nr:DUF1018 domain-containing protein [Chitinivibrionales bacterium]
MASKGQLRKIHVLGRELGLDDSEYRAVLSQYKTADGARVTSSTQLSVDQASRLIDSLEYTAGHRSPPSDEPRATPGQVRKIAALWRQVTRAEDNQGRRRTLDSFIQHKYHVPRLGMLPRRMVPKVIKALSVMKQQEARRNPPGRGDDARDHPD